MKYPLSKLRGAALETGGMLVSETVKIEIQLEAVKQ